MPTLQLKNFQFAELFRAEGLLKLDETFINELPCGLKETLLAYRQDSQNFSDIEISEFLIATAAHLETFLASLFNIKQAVDIASTKTISNNPIAVFKKFYILRNAKKQALKADQFRSFSELNEWLTAQLKTAEITSHDTELSIALLGNQFLQQPDLYSAHIETLIQWCARAMTSPEGQQFTAAWQMFKIPKKLDYSHLVSCKPLANDKLERLSVDDSHLRFRDGFKLTDPRMNARQVQDEVNYCIYCHDHDGDFCSKGFPVKKGDATQGFKKNPLDVTLTGCPLEEKISEMNLLKRDGYTLASLAMVMVDNPMCPATGHRICNDCMKSCIYQKQDPVNIPQIETRVLTDVLALPWGVEIYDLLTRWNPLRHKQFVMKPYNSLKVMIAGMGPAGFTLAHHLLLEGFAVVGFDGLKIEPLPQNLLTDPIYQFSELTESLDERLMAGFGGVAEYGITVRWDKNFLKLIYISLMRRPYFQAFGSVRFGGTIKVEDAWDMGFDHFVLAVGAGLPKALSIPGSLAPGMRQANDFLMALQLGNAAKQSSLTNIQVRLPAAIIGGGLTGVDTATEVQAYYIRQVEKILTRYEILEKKYSQDAILKKLDLASTEILNEFLAHGRAVRDERNNAHCENRPANFIKLIRQWGGVSIVYRRSMQESPAYINNHEELQKALEEGLYYLEYLEPSAVDLNQFGHVETLICHRRRHNGDEWETTTEAVKVPARSIFVATGTQPNVAYEFEHKGTFSRIGFQYQHYEETDGELSVAPGIENCKAENFGAFTSYHKHDKRVSLIGDTHPVFHGNVVKAIASGLRTYPKILATLQSKLHAQGNDTEYTVFSEKMRHLFSSCVTDIRRLAPSVIELCVQAPLAAKHFKAGHFYRLQNYETFAPRISNTSLQIEPLALIASGVDVKRETLTFLILEKGASSKLCATFKIGDPIALMGPTGTRAKIADEHETILIIGNQLGIAMLNSYGPALREKGNRVIFLGNFHDTTDIFCQEAIENAADVVIWVTQSENSLKNIRPQDYSAQGDYLEILMQYAKGELNAKKPSLLLTDVDRIFIIDNTQVLRDFQRARQLQLKEIFPKDPKVSGSVYSTMQCMLKGVCAQCLQWQVDPETGKRTKAVFACSWPEQPLELIDFDNIDERQIQNRLQEQLSSLWVDYLLSENEITRI